MGALPSILGDDRAVALQPGHELLVSLLGLLCADVHVCAHGVPLSPSLLSSLSLSPPLPPSLPPSLSRYPFIHVSLSLSHLGAIETHEQDALARRHARTLGRPCGRRIPGADVCIYLHSLGEARLKGAPFNIRCVRAFCTSVSTSTAPLPGRAAGDGLSHPFPLSVRGKGSSSLGL